jgi:hypothetical protein
MTALCGRRTHLVAEGAPSSSEEHQIEHVVCPFSGSRGLFSTSGGELRKPGSGGRTWFPRKSRRGMLMGWTAIGVLTLVPVTDRSGRNLMTPSVSLPLLLSLSLSHTLRQPHTPSLSLSHAHSHTHSDSHSHAHSGAATRRLRAPPPRDCVPCVCGAWRITLIGSRNRFYLRFAWGLEPFWFQSVHLND